MPAASNSAAHSRNKILTQATKSLGMTPTGVQHTRAAYALGEASQLCSVGPWWLRQQYYKGKLKALKIAGKLVIPASEIDRLLTESVATYEPATKGIGTIAARCARERAAKRRKSRTQPTKRKIATT